MSFRKLSIVCAVKPLIGLLLEKRKGFFFIFKVNMVCPLQKRFV